MLIPSKMEENERFVRGTGQEEGKRANLKGQCDGPYLGHQKERCEAAYKLFHDRTGLDQLYKDRLEESRLLVVWIEGFLLGWDRSQRGKGYYLAEDELAKMVGGGA